MPLAIDNVVDIELFIEGRRLLLFEKITHGNINHPNPPPSNKEYYSSLFVNSYGERVPYYPDDLMLLFNSIPLEEEEDPSLYKVIESSWSVAESIRVFKVKHLSIEYFYYAFMLDDYIVCPAFLARSLSIRLKDVACLNVTSGAIYSYIFVKMDSNDPHLNIAGNLFSFCGRHVIKLSLRKKRVLDLTFENKDIKCFITPESNETEFHAEWNQMTRNLKKNPKRSDLHIDYYYVPSKKFCGFKSRHGIFLKDHLYIGLNALIHEKSKSYHRIFIFPALEMDRYDERDTEFQLVPLKEIFTNTPYKREDYILDKLVTHLEQNYEKSKYNQPGEYYCSMLAIIQSSGYGKSKLIERLGSRTPTFYSSLQQGTGVPVRSFFLVRLIKELDMIFKTDLCTMNNVATAVYIYLLRILYVILMNPKNSTLEKNFQIDEIENYEIFSYISMIMRGDRREKIFEDLFDESLDELCRSKTTRIWFSDSQSKPLSDFLERQTNLNRLTLNSKTVNDLERTVMIKIDELRKNNKLPSIFVVDSAKGLHYRKSGEKYDWRFLDWDVDWEKEVYLQNRGPYSVFRRIFRMFKYTWMRLMLIVVGGNGQISLSLPELELDPSRRRSDRNKFLENFALAQTYNVNSELALTINADSFPDWNLFLTSCERIEEFFKLGRPLIYSNFKMYIWRDLSNFNFNAPFAECKEFSFLREKLFGGSTNCTNTSNEAQLYSMFNFAFGTHFLPSHLRVEELIEKYLMTLIRSKDVDGVQHFVARFLPEGALNILSTKYFVDYPDSFRETFVSSIKYGLCTIDNFGQLLAQYILLRVAFNCIDSSRQMIRRITFQPTELKKFLAALTDYGSEASLKRFFDLNPNLVNSRISFSYFEHFPNIFVHNPYDLMARCVLKASAVTLHGSFPGINLMIPLILENGRLSFLGIKVTFVKYEDVSAAISDATEKMTFANMFGECQEHCPFGLIILALGDYKSEGGKTLEVFLTREGESSPADPAILVFQGIPRPVQDTSLPSTLNPEYVSYPEVCSEHLKTCDQLFGLIQELPFSDEAKKALDDYKPRGY
jgi:hypothetical protein